MKTISPPLLIGGGVLLLVLIASAWLAKKGSAGNVGASIGGAAVDLVYGTALGVVGGVNTALGIPTTTDLINAANSSSNPLQPVGSWLGGTFYDYTHTTQNGGVL